MTRPADVAPAFDSGGCARCAPTEALAQARRTYAANLAALADHSPELLRFLDNELPAGEYVFGRDGSLTIRNAGRWLDDCSVPAAAAAAMLRSIQFNSPSMIMIAPTHAQQLRVALDKSSAGQAIIAIIPDDDSLQTILALADFVDDLRAGRLHFAVGSAWQASLARVFEKNPGLPVPTQSVKLSAVPGELCTPLQADFERIIGEVNRSQGRRIEYLVARRRTVARPARRWCVAGTMAFSPWNDGPQIVKRLLAAADRPTEIEQINFSNPTQASTHLLAQFTDRADALLTPDFGRADLPGIVNAAVGWVTLAVTRVPRFEAAAPADRLVLVDTALADAARQAGWPANRILCRPESRETSAVGHRVTLIFDRPPRTIPHAIESFSSHRLLWERLRDDLEAGRFTDASPFDQVARYARAIDLDLSRVPLDLFVTHLIEPALATFAARSLSKSIDDFVLAGTGWEEAEDLAACWAGPVESHPEMDRKLEAASVLIDVWTTRRAHAVRRSGRPVVKAWGLTPDKLVRSARLAAGSVRPAASSEPISWPELIRFQAGA